MKLYAKKYKKLINYKNYNFHRNATTYKQMKTIAQHFAQIYAISDFASLWACPNMPGHAYLKYGN